MKNYTDKEDILEEIKESMIKFEKFFTHGTLVIEIRYQDKKICGAEFDYKAKARFFK